MKEKNKKLLTFFTNENSYGEQTKYFIVKFQEKRKGCCLSFLY